MTESKVDILLHPVRMRILQSLVSENLTVQQMKERLPDIPQATLYRHLNKLFEAGVIFVIQEQQVRGTVEKLYSITPKEADITNNDIQRYSKEQYMELFMKYMANLLGEYERYVSQDKVDFEKDGVSLRQATMYLSDDEFQDFIHELRGVYAKILPNKPSAERRKRIFANIIIPEAREKE
ncbi:helix-turn-helix domain-containing protein [Bacillus sp. BGMRC 2118]|nr:helix-turn-helix domain-containing protein [Bacillus sp. BGMRC 2118]